MLILENKVYYRDKFENEQELEKLVIDHYDKLFGKHTIYLPQVMIADAAGTSSIPDGIAVDLKNKRWYVVEIELKSHGVWSHIVPQISRHLVAINDISERKKLIRKFFNTIKSDPRVSELIEEIGIRREDLWQELENIIEKDPMIVIIIDGIPTPLKKWTKTFKIKYNLIEILKYKNSEGEVIYYIPDEATTPDVGPEEEEEEERRDKKTMTFDEFKSKCREPLCYLFDKFVELANKYPAKIKIIPTQYGMSIRVAAGQKMYSVFTLYTNSIYINKYNEQNLSKLYGPDKVEKFFNKLRTIEPINRIFDLRVQPGVGAEDLTSEDADIIVEALETLISS